jgi:hypothetical protein
MAVRREKCRMGMAQTHTYRATPLGAGDRGERWRR